MTRLFVLLFLVLLATQLSTRPFKHEGSAEKKKPQRKANP